MGEIVPGTVFGGLRIDAVAGRGGMGVVYRATQLALNRTVAVKVVTPELADDPEFRERFKRESELAASIDHPHLVPVYNAGEEDGRLFVIMRFVEGTDLRRLIQRDGPLEPRRATEIVNQVARALDAAHARGLVHRDVKPANILIADGERVHVYLTDFGLTKQLAAGATGGLTRTGAVMGTVDYIAPEQLDGRPVDRRVDVYALGCVLFEALTGQVPFVRDSDAAKMWAHMGAPPPALGDVAPHLPRQLDEVLRRAMAKNPSERYATAGELARAAVVAVALGAPADTRVAAPVTRPAVPTAPAPGAAPLTAPAPARPPGSSNPSVPPPAAGFPVAPGHPVPTGPSVPGLSPYRAPAGPSPAEGYQLLPGAPPRRRRTLPIVLSVVGAVLVLGLIAGALVYVGRGGQTPQTPQTPPLGPRAAGDVIATARTGREPSSVVEAGGFLWTADTGAISKIDPRTGTTRAITVGGVPYTLAVGDGAVWVHNNDHSVVRVDIASGAVSAPIPTGDSAITYIVSGGDYLWLSHREAGTVSRLNMRSKQVEGSVKVGNGPGAMAFAEETLYVVNEQDATVSAIDGATGQVIGQPLAVPGSGGGIRTYERILYVATSDGVTPVDSATFVTGRPIQAKGWAYFAVGAGSLWASYPTENVIRRFDLETGQPQGEPIRGIGKDISTIEFINGELVAVNRTTDTITRIRPAA